MALLTAWTAMLPADSIPMIESVYGHHFRCGQSAPIILRDFRIMIPDILSDCGCQPNCPQLFACETAAPILIAARFAVRSHDTQVRFHGSSPRFRLLLNYWISGSNKSMRQIDAGKARRPGTLARVGLRMKAANRGQCNPMRAALD